MLRITQIERGKKMIVSEENKNKLAAKINEIALRDKSDVPHSEKMQKVIRLMMAEYPELMIGFIS